MTNEELQWAISEALDNAIKAIEYTEKIDRPFTPEQPGLGPLIAEAVVCHLKNLIHIQQSRAEKEI